MYYNRTISTKLSKLIENGGELRWLFDFVKNHKELDFLIGKNKSEESISIYRGLTRIIKILPRMNNSIKIEAADKYKSIVPNLFGLKGINENFEKDIINLINEIEKNPKFDQYYKRKKEGFYQNELSRVYGICSTPESDFVIIDKEAVIGYMNKPRKNFIFGPQKEKYKQLQKEISIIDGIKYGKDLGGKSIGNELDFLALDKSGNILLIEYKHGTNTSGIYLSPLQIGLYYDIFTNFPKSELEQAVFQMLEQKQKIGLINPDWKKPSHIRDIIPVLIISEHNYNSCAKTNFEEIMQIVRIKHGAGFLNTLQTLNFTMKNGLSNW